MDKDSAKLFNNDREITNIIGDITPEIMLLQARIWERQNKNLDVAYEYAMTLIKLKVN